MSVFDDILVVLIQTQGVLFILVTLITLQCLVQVGFLGSLLRRSDSSSIRPKKRRFWQRDKKAELKGDKKELTD